MPVTPPTIPLEDTNPTIDTKEEDNMRSLELKIDDTIVTVSWEDNTSVNALIELAKNGLTINMHEYGGFEQTSMIDSTITSNDSRIDRGFMRIFLSLSWIVWKLYFTGEILIKYDGK